jgi:hypothetical protein
MYSIPAALVHLDQNETWVLVFSACGWISGIILYFEGMRLTWRDKVPGIPLGWMFIVFAHDANFVLHADFLSHEANHWYFNFINSCFLPWPFLDFVAVVWLSIAARKEIAPQLPLPAYFAICVLYQLIAIALYMLLVSWIDDPLYLTGWSIAQIINIVFMIPMALRRRSTRGQSRLMAWTLLLGPASTAMLISPSIVPALLTPTYWAATACTTVMSLAYLLLFEHYHHQERQAADASIAVAA